MALRTVGVAVTLMAVAAGSLSIAERVRETGEDAGGTSAGGHPNILLLVLDTVRAWNLGLYGYARPTTPRLDRRFAGGVVFDRALAAAPWTLPSHASMFTGRLPSDLSANWDRPLDGTPPTVAEVLRAAGYATGGFVGNFRYAGSSSGLGRGFDRYVDYPVDGAEALRMTAMGRRLFRNPKLQEWLSLHRILEAKYAEVVNRDFLAWVDRHPNRPFFGFVNYVDAHAPYLPPAPYDSLWSKPGGDPNQIGRRYVAGVERTFGAGPVPGTLIEEYIDGYDGAISYLDVQIDSLLGALERRGRLANTIVILTADHGEHFGEHRLVQHGNSLYLPLLHVPLAVWAPGRIPGGLRIGSPASLRNVAATIADLAGVPAGGLAGRSLAPLWRADSLGHAPDTLAAAVDWHGTLTKFPPSPLLDGSLRAVLSDSLHYIVRADGVEELYHLGQDFLEARNLAGIPTYHAALLDARAKLIGAVGPGRGPRP